MAAYINNSFSWTVFTRSYSIIEFYLSISILFHPNDRIFTHQIQPNDSGVGANLQVLVQMVSDLKYNKFSSDPCYNKFS